MESVWLQQLSRAYSLWSDWSQDEKTYNISKTLKVCAWDELASYSSPYPLVGEELGLRLLTLPGVSLFVLASWSERSVGLDWCQEDGG